MAHACFFEISPPLSPTLSHSFVVGEGEKSGAVSRCALWRLLPEQNIALHCEKPKSEIRRDVPGKNPP
jgi:hypothetical protein